MNHILWGLDMINVKTLHSNGAMEAIERYAARQQYSNEVGRPLNSFGGKRHKRTQLVLNPAIHEPHPPPYQGVRGQL